MKQNGHFTIGFNREVMLIMQKTTEYIINTLAW